MRVELQLVAYLSRAQLALVVDVDSDSLDAEDLRGDEVGDGTRIVQRRPTFKTELQRLSSGLRENGVASRMIAHLALVRGGEILQEFHRHRAESGMELLDTRQHLLGDKNRMRDVDGHHDDVDMLPPLQDNGRCFRVAQDAAEPIRCQYSAFSTRSRFLEGRRQ